MKTPWIKWSLLSAFSGILSGTAATVFLFLLDWATETRMSHPEIIWFLPLAGFCLGWVYFAFGKDVAGGNNLVLEQIHSPQKIIPLRMAPFVLLGTLITHLFGGSAGREGTAVQMGASLSDQLSKYFRVSQEERRILLMTGAGAGFGAAIGTPLAGILFGLEFVRIGRIRFVAVWESIVACFFASLTCHFLGAPHTLYPKPEITSFSFSILAWIALAGAIFGLVAQAFARGTHILEHLEKKTISYPPLKPFLAGILIVILYFWEGSYRYAGLGISAIQDSFHKVSSLKDPLYKFFFSILTIGSGFKGGEFIPLVFIGCTLGSALSQWVPVSSDLLAAVGFAAVFGAASNTPLACTLMAVELFGIEIAPYAFVACFTGYFFSGHSGIYANQPGTKYGCLSTFDPFRDQK